MFLPSNPSMWIGLVVNGIRHKRIPSSIHKSDVKQSDDLGNTNIVQMVYTRWPWWFFKLISIISWFEFVFRGEFVGSNCISPSFPTSSITLSWIWIDMEEPSDDSLESAQQNEPFHNSQFSLDQHYFPLDQTSSNKWNTPFLYCLSIE